MQSANKSFIIWTMNVTKTEAPTKDESPSEILEQFDICLFPELVINGDFRNMQMCRLRGVLIVAIYVYVETVFSKSYFGTRNSR